jgi:cation transport ATPase
MSSAKKNNNKKYNKDKKNEKKEKPLSELRKSMRGTRRNLFRVQGFFYLLLIFCMLMIFISNMLNGSKVRSVSISLTFIFIAVILILNLIVIFQNLFMKDNKEFEIGNKVNASLTLIMLIIFILFCLFCIIINILYKNPTTKAYVLNIHGVANIAGISRDTNYAISYVFYPLIPPRIILCGS